MNMLRDNIQYRLATWYVGSSVYLLSGTIVNYQNMHDSANNINGVSCGCYGY